MHVSVFERIPLLAGFLTLILGGEGVAVSLDACISF
jgi:hypothetical protein